MHINKNSWHYKLYEFTYLGNFLPSNTNLCQYLRRFSLVLPVAFLVFFVYMTLAICNLVVFILASPFGLIPKRVFDTGVKPYKGLPLGKFQLYPGHVLAVVVPIGIHFELAKHFGTEFSLGVAATWMGLLALGVFFFYKRNSEFFSLVKAWLNARKRSICPMVEFTNEPTQLDPEEG